MVRLALEVLWEEVTSRVYQKRYHLTDVDKGKGKVNQLDVENKKTNTTVVVTIQGQVKNSKNKTCWPTIRASDNYRSTLRTSEKQ